LFDPEVVEGATRRVIGGVLVSTLLTLFVVPCVYELLARFERDRRAVEKRQQEIVDATRN